MGHSNTEYYFNRLNWWNWSNKFNLGQFLGNFKNITQLTNKSLLLKKIIIKFNSFFPISGHISPIFNRWIFSQLVSRFFSCRINENRESTQKLNFSHFKRTCNVLMVAPDQVYVHLHNRAPCIITFSRLGKETLKIWY